MLEVPVEWAFSRRDGRFPSGKVIGSEPGSCRIAFKQGSTGFIQKANFNPKRMTLAAEKLVVFPNVLGTERFALGPEGFG
jgi:hypothetical protein